MDDKLKNGSVNIDEDTWYYEEPGHVTLVHWVTERDGFRVAHQIKIPWRKLKASVERKYSPSPQRTRSGAG